MMLFRVVFVGLFLIVSHKTLVRAQCSSVNSTVDPVSTICATLHIFTDGSYTTRSAGNLEISRDSWIFAGVISDIRTQLYDCWATAELNSDNPVSITRDGCLQEDTFYDDNTRTGFYKFYGKFLSFLPENTQNLYVQCEVTTNCPAFSGCQLVCQGEPVRYLLTSERIKVQQSENSETTTVNIVVVLIVIGVCFFILLLLILLILLCRMMKRRRKRRQGGNISPILYNTTPINDDSHQNEYAETSQPENDSFTDVYAKVNKNSVNGNAVP